MKKKLSIETLEAKCLLAGGGIVGGVVVFDSFAQEIGADLRSSFVGKTSPEIETYPWENGEGFEGWGDGGDPFGEDWGFPEPNWILPDTNTDPNAYGV